MNQLKNMLDLNDPFFVGNKVDCIVDLSDGSSNSVYAINDSYIYKKFAYKERLRKEILGMQMYKNLTRGNIPSIMEIGNDYFITDCVKNATSAYQLISLGTLSMDKISVAVASLVARNYWGYNLGGETTKTKHPRMQWETNLNEIKENFEKNRDEIVKHIGTRTYRQILSKLRLVEKEEYPLTILHGDIHLDNILVSEKCGYQKFYLIDFEHSMEGPIELEFQNSLVWQDEKSLDIVTIVDLLINHYRVPYDPNKEKLLRAVYVANQINNALEENQRWKIAYLA